MKANELKANQAVLKTKYQHSPETAVQDLYATGEIDSDNLAFEITHPKHLTPAGLHVFSGGDGTYACPVELMLAGWAGCAGVTCAAVAHSMKLKMKTATVTAIGQIDFKGTLAVDRDAPIGLTKLELRFAITSDEPREKIDKLISLTERYCVVHQTFLKVPKMTVSIDENNMTDTG